MIVRCNGNFFWFRELWRRWSRFIKHRCRCCHLFNFHGLGIFKITTIETVKVWTKFSYTQLQPRPTCTLDILQYSFRMFETDIQPLFILLCCCSLAEWTREYLRRTIYFLRFKSHTAKKKELI